MKNDLGPAGEWVLTTLPSTGEGPWVEYELVHTSGDFSDTIRVDMRDQRGFEDVIRPWVLASRQKRNTLYAPSQTSPD